MYNSAMNEIVAMETTTTDKIPPKQQEPGIHVFRAAATVLVVLFHAYLYWAADGATEDDLEDKIDRVNRNMGLKLLSFANLSVDGFIVLSGYLAARSWVTDPTSSSKTISRSSLRRYLTNKVSRILVPYWLTLAGIALFELVRSVSGVGRGSFHSSSGSSDSSDSFDTIFDPIFGAAYCPRTLVLSPLLMNNFIGFGGCGVHLWSVAVQMHLFVLFGLGVAWMRSDRSDRSDRSATKHRSSLTIAIAATLFAATALLRVALATHFGSRFPPPPFDHQHAS